MLQLICSLQLHKYQLLFSEYKNNTNTLATVIWFPSGEGHSSNLTQSSLLWYHGLPERSVDAARESTCPGIRTGLHGVQTLHLNLINRAPQWNEQTAQRNENKSYSMKCSLTEQFSSARHCNKHCIHLTFQSSQGPCEESNKITSTL